MRKCQSQVLDYTGYSYIQEYIDSIRLYIYGIAVMLYAISSLITITNVFIVFVNGDDGGGR